MNLSHTRLFVVNSLTLVLVSFLYTFSLQAQWTNGQDAAYVLGQSIFTTSVAGTTQEQMSGPGGIAIDATNNKLYVVDVNNNRVLRFGLPITSNNPSAEIVFGQPNFTSSGTGTTQNTFNNPRAAAVDAAGNLYIVEFNNNRILRFNAAHAIAVNQPNANWVYGQPNFTSSAAATTQTGLSSPFAIAISSVTGDVFVADRQNRRIVRYPAASLTSNGPNANLVLGAANYTTVGSAVPAQNSTPFPNGVTVIGNTLYVSDNNAVRVVAFDNIGSKVNGDNADRVLGQPNFTASATAVTATGMGSPTRIATDGTNLFVGDGNVGANNRVLIFNNANAKVNGAAADNVLGQPNFTTSGINLTQRGMNSATGLAFVGSVLFVADISQNRVLIFAQSGMNVAGNVAPYNPRPTTTPLMNTMNYGTPTGSPVKVPMNTAGVNSIDVTFSQPLAPWVFSNGTTSPNARDAMKVFGTTSRGYRSGIGFAGSGATLQFTTTASVATSFNPGENVWVTVTNAQSTGFAPTRPFVMGFRTAAGTGPVNFTSQPTGSPFATGNSPQGMALADFDGDGDLDMAVANYTANTASILVNNGSGSYTPHPVTPTPAAGASPYLLIAGDVDNDGDIDLAVANDGTGVTIMFNNGSGGFGMTTSVPGGDPTGLALADIDADGDLDLMTTNFTANTVTTRLNNGSGGFGAATPYATGGGPGAVGMGDIDNDGDLDMAVSANTGNRIDVFMNSGYGTFYAPSVPNYATGTGPRSVNFADLNNDGFMDVVTVSGGSGNANVFLNNTAGGFAAAVNYTTGTTPFPVRLGDIDGDGDLDMVVANNGSNNVTVRLNNGAGNFTTIAGGSPFAAGGGSAPWGMELGDVDGDGDVDIAMTKNTGNLVVVLLNAPPMTVLGNVPPYNPRPTTTPLLNTMNYGTPSGSPVKVPMNTVPTGISVTFSQNVTAATFTDAGANNARNVMKVHDTTSRGYRSGVGFSGAGATMNFTTTANFNVGEQVWVTVTHAQSTAGASTRPFVMGFRTRAGAGPATFPTQPAGSPFAAGTSTFSVAFGDVDGDGDLDVATANFSSNNVSVLLNNGSGSYTGAVGSPFAVGGTDPRSVAFGDVDGDGDLDVATANFNSTNVSILLNNGSGGYTAAVGSPFAVGASPRSVAFGDVDGDGDLDVAT
ncbi:MAG: FG-GAP-like repeat-containing protein, partial [Candidatus Kapaibacteriota bacterium]